MLIRGCAEIFKLVNKLEAGRPLLQHGRYGSISIAEGAADAIPCRRKVQGPHSCLLGALDARQPDPQLQDPFLRELQGQSSWHLHSTTSHLLRHSKAAGQQV